MLSFEGKILDFKGKILILERLVSGIIRGQDIVGNKVKILPFLIPNFDFYGIKVEKFVLWGIGKVLELVFYGNISKFLRFWVCFFFLVAEVKIWEVLVFPWILLLDLTNF